MPLPVGGAQAVVAQHIGQRRRVQGDWCIHHAGLDQPSIEFGQAAPAFLVDLAPDVLAPVLHVLLDDAFLPPSRPVAELGLKQVVPGHGFKPGVDAALFANAHLIHRSAHVVVDAPLGDATKGCKRAGVGVEEHFVGLGEVGNQQLGSAGGQLGVGYFQAPAQFANDGVFAAPVKQEGFAHLKAQGHEASMAWGDIHRDLEVAAVDVDLCLAACAAHCPDGLVVSLYGAPITLAAVAVGLDPELQVLLVRIYQSFCGYPLGVCRLHHAWLCQPAGGGVSGDAQPVWPLRARVRCHATPCASIC